jgi:hypothetical protein
MSSGVPQGGSTRWGNAVTVFFDTPGWPTASYKIEVRGRSVSDTTNAHIAAAPNVCLSDAKSYLFLRGNSVYANNATPANGIQVVYSATLDNVRLAAGSTRTSASNNYWVRPGDTFTFTSPSGTNNSNIGAAPGFSQVAVVTSVRQKGGPDRLVVEFSVPIVTTAVQGYRPDTAAGEWPRHDLVFFAGANPGAANSTGVGLSFNRLSVQVSSAAGWSGTLSAAANLSYPLANSPALFVPAPGDASPAAAGLINPEKMLISSAEYIKVNGRQMYTEPDVGGGGPSVNYDRAWCKHTFEHAADFNQGTAPYRCISLVVDADWDVEVLVHPLH